MSIESDNPYAQKMRDFAYHVSHDLNAPLRAAGSFSKIMLDSYGDTLDAQGKEYLELIAREATRAQSMLQGLLEYSRLDTMAKSITTHLEPSVVFEHCQVILAKEIKQTGAVFHSGPLPSIQADAEQFMQLLLYLFDNALKFVAPGTKPDILFQGVEEPTHWHFSVTDHGIGIDEAQRERAFILFRQLNLQDSYPGVGMGLTLAQKIVERHQGRIWIEAAKHGTGTVVHFTIQKK